METKLEILENEDLTFKNTYRIHTKAKYFCSPKNVEELKEAINFAKEKKIPYFILGNGSNILMDDTPYKGIMISMKEMNHMKCNDKSYYIKAECGVMLPKLVMTSIEHGMGGLEWASGIPGTLGGAIYGNAGAYLGEIYEFLESVTVLRNDEIILIPKQELKYGYRTSMFKENKRDIILEATLQLHKGVEDVSLKVMEDRRKRRMESQPIEYPSAGSVFRNPSKETPAGMLIDSCGLKGRQKGGAIISPKHANFIVNMGGAKAHEVRALIELAQEKVKKEKGIELHCEQEILDWR